jgi:hypothetical protein
VKAPGGESEDAWVANDEMQTYDDEKGNWTRSKQDQFKRFPHPTKRACFETYAAKNKQTPLLALTLGWDPLRRNLCAINYVLDCLEGPHNY